MKRMKVILHENRLAELKRLAGERRQTLSSLVDEFLALGLEKAKARPRKKAAIRLPSFSMGKPRVNVADRDQLEEFLSGR